MLSCKWFTVLSFIISCNAMDYYDDVDPVIEMLMNDNIIEEYTDTNNVSEDEFVFKDGLWRCGDCVDLNNVVYNERYDFDYNKVEEDNEIQVGISIEGMRCVTVSASKDATVSLVGGSCAGDLTLGLTRAEHCQINIYT